MNEPGVTLAQHSAPSTMIGPTWDLRTTATGTLAADVSSRSNRLRDPFFANI